MLNFLTSLFGPIFAKEMVEIARRKRYYFNRVLYGTGQGMIAFWIILGTIFATLVLIGILAVALK